MTIYYEGHGVTLHHGDCLDVLRTMADNSVDSVVTDPPYGLEFMGKEWDAFKPAAARIRKPSDRDQQDGAAHNATTFLATRNMPDALIAGHPFQRWCELWAVECLRVLKPGGHLLAFGGTRTFHRLACAVEDAGFEVRDSIAWLYGSGFPKSMDVSKAIDKKRDDRSDVAALTSALADLAHAAGITRSDVDEYMSTSDMGGWWLSRLPHRAACPSVDNWTRLRDLIPGASALDAEVWRLNGRKGSPGEAWDQREVIGTRTTGIGTGKGAVAYIADSENRDVTAPATDDARTWQGWGTALKPAFEPIVVARKPLIGTVAANVLTHGTGALNVDACRIEGAKGWPDSKQYASGIAWGDNKGDAFTQDNSANPSKGLGRWPANVILDEHQADALDEMSGETLSKRSGGRQTPKHGTEAYGDFAGTDNEAGHDDTGGASRFFYTAKADADERPRINGTAHPTVKPLSLMRWLVRLVTPPGGTVLEPFAGSGTTAEACILEGFQCVAIEREAEYLPLILARITRQRDPVAAIKLNGDDLGLFDFGSTA